VSGADGIGDTKGRSRDGKRQVSREGSEFQIRVSVLKNFKKNLPRFLLSAKPARITRKKVLTRLCRFR
jgi:hypothetical protein